MSSYVFMSPNVPHLTPAGGKGVGKSVRAGLHNWSGRELQLFKRLATVAYGGAPKLEISLFRIGVYGV